MDMMDTTTTAYGLAEALTRLSREGYQVAYVYPDGAETAMRSPHDSAPRVDLAGWAEEDSDLVDRAGLILGEACA